MSLHSHIIVIVGIGRPFLYAYSSYGAEGVDKALQILHVCSVLPSLIQQTGTNL